MAMSCCSDPRRGAVRRFGGRTGLDFVEVSGDQLTLYVYFLGKLPPEFAQDQPGLERHLRIEGGSRSTGLRILDVDPHHSDDPELDDWLVLHLDRYGDHSRYVLRLVDVGGVDPMYAQADFSFKVGCPSDLDCMPAMACVDEPPPEPELHYLARDFTSFRRLIEDRLAQISPDWTERHVPDLGVALTELLACTGDHLAYHQDAVATEAYLDTARQRISVRRHVRLVDYRLHEGNNARAWVTIETSQDLELAAADVQFLGGIPADAPLPVILGPSAAEAAGRLEAEVFEPMLAADATLNWRQAHNRIRFHDWGRNDCCLPRGSTRAVLVDAWTGDGEERALALQPGDVLVLREVRGARTGLEPDADPTRCIAVRLTRVTPDVDPLVLVATDDGVDGGQALPLLDVEWHPDDALPFALCLSALGPAPECARVDDVSLAFGNVVLVDHGRRVAPEDLGTIPAAHEDHGCLCEGQPAPVSLRAGRVHWALARTPLTHAEPPPSPRCAAGASLRQDPRGASPALLLDDSDGASWTPVFDLLSSRPGDHHVVAELDNAGIARLRFGDDEMGRRPCARRAFQARYRIGNGPAGNVGPWSINRMRLANELDGVSLQIGNPMPAEGGTAREPLSEARMYAPSQFRKTLLRAITADDYAAIAGLHPRVQRAACELVWTGSWYEADVALDPHGAVEVDPALVDEVGAALDMVRRMGHDVHVEPAAYVPIDLALEVCALPGHERGAVRAALLETFGAGRMRDGQPGLFHPDRLSFGDSLHLSRIVADAMAVPGVECARVTRLQRLFQPASHEIEDGVLPLSAHEIARLDNDPNHPEHGRLTIQVGGGR